MVRLEVAGGVVQLSSPDCPSPLSFSLPTDWEAERAMGSFHKTAVLGGSCEVGYTPALPVAGHCAGVGLRRGGRRLGLRSAEGRAGRTAANTPRQSNQHPPAFTQGTARSIHTATSGLLFLTFLMFHMIIRVTLPPTLVLWICRTRLVSATVRCEHGGGPPARPQQRGPLPPGDLQQPGRARRRAPRLHPGRPQLQVVKNSPTRNSSDRIQAEPGGGDGQRGGLAGGRLEGRQDRVRHP